jgi:hypothetical protein
MTITQCADPRNVDEIVRAWPKIAQEAATSMMEKYGPPNEACAGRLVWHDNGPWRHTFVYSEEVAHNFPAPHHDVLEQYIPYRVPVDKFNDLTAFDGSVLVDRTKGEMAARCQGEASNFLALNLAHDIIEGRRSVQEARIAYGEAMKARRAGKTPEIMQKLLFETPRGYTGDLDETII